MYIGRISVFLALIHWSTCDCIHACTLTIIISKFPTIYIGMCFSQHDICYNSYCSSYCQCYTVKEYSRGG